MIQIIVVSTMVLILIATIAIAIYKKKMEKSGRKRKIRIRPWMEMASYFIRIILIVLNVAAMFSFGYFFLYNFSMTLN